MKRILTVISVLGLGVSLLIAGTLFATGGEAGKVDLCHLEKKVDMSLVFNDGHVIDVNVKSCKAHCKHLDQPMPIPLDNNAHENRACARIHVVNGLPSCEVNTTSTIACSVDVCLERCENSAGF